MSRLFTQAVAGIFAQGTFEQIVPFAVFGAFATVAWLVLDHFGTNRNRADERLEEIRDPSLRRRKEEASSARKKTAMSQMLAKASAASKPLQPKNEF